MGGQDMADAYFVRGLATRNNMDFMYCKNNKNNLKVFSLENVEKELQKSNKKILCVFLM